MKATINSNTFPGADQHWFLTVLRQDIGQISTWNTFLIIKNTFRVEIWPISCLNDSENPGKVDFKELKSKTFSGGACSQNPLEASAFGTRLGNWSVLILDLRLFPVVVFYTGIPLLAFCYLKQDRVTTFLSFFCLKKTLSKQKISLLVEQANHFLQQFWL